MPCAVARFVWLTRRAEKRAMTIDWDSARPCVWAGFAYAISVFAIGFALGAIRVTVLVPRLGPMASVLLEAPVILMASWYVSKAVTARFDVAAEFGPRGLMGATAFAVLMGCEFALAALVFDQSSSQFVRQYATAPGMIGLVAQVCFAAFPLWQARRWRVQRSLFGNSS